MVPVRRSREAAIRETDEPGNAPWSPWHGLAMKNGRQEKRRAARGATLRGKGGGMVNPGCSIAIAWTIAPNRKNCQ